LPFKTVFDSTSTPPTEARASPLGTAVVDGEVLVDELATELSGEESKDPTAVVSVLADLKEEGVAGNSIVTAGREAGAVTPGEVTPGEVTPGEVTPGEVTEGLLTEVVVEMTVVKVVDGAFDVTIDLEPETILPGIPPVYATTYSVLAVSREKLAKNSVGQTGLLLWLSRRPLEVPLPESTVTPSFLIAHDALTVNGVLLPVLFRQPLICI